MVQAGSCFGNSGPAKNENASAQATACRNGKIERIGANEERAKTTPTSGRAASPWCRTGLALSRSCVTTSKPIRPETGQKKEVAPPSNSVSMGKIELLTS